MYDALEREAVGVSLADPETVWEEKLADASLRLDDEIDAATLAGEYGGDRGYVDDLCSEVVGVAIAEGDNVVTLAHFEVAAEQLDRVPQNEDTDAKRDAPHREMKSDGAGGEVVASTTDAEEGTIEDCDEPDQDDEPSEPTVEIPDDLDARLDEFEDRLGGLESDFAELRQFLVKDLALIKGTLRKLVDADESANVDVLPEQADNTRALLDRHEDQLQDLGEELNAFDELTKGAKTDGGSVSKAVQVRRHLVEKAKENGGTFAMNGKQVASFFDGRDDSVSHSRGCQIVREAVGEKEGWDAPAGFSLLHKHSNQPMKAKVDLSNMADRAVYRLQQTPEEGEG